MKVSGKSLVNSTLIALCVAIAGMIYMTMTNNDEVSASDAFYAESAKIPESAVYLGSKMGGYFVTLERQDITLDDGRIMPAFYMEMYHAWANQRDYGAERVGELAFKGPAIYAPPTKLLEESNGGHIEPPALGQILINDGRWVNGGVLHIRLKSGENDPENEYIAQIIPM